MSTPRLSLVVCTYRRPEAVSKLLHALESQEHPADETLVIDSSPDALTQEVVLQITSRKQLPELHYYSVDAENAGLTRQRKLRHPEVPARNRRISGRRHCAR